MRDAWIDPNGKLIEVSTHNEFASDLLEEEMGIVEMLDYIEDNGMDYPNEVLHKRGWVRVKFNDSYLPRVEILGGCISLVKQMRNTIDPAMNTTQLRIAKQICEEQNTAFNMAINDKRFW